MQTIASDGVGPMAGDLLLPKIGQELRFGIIYGQPVVCLSGSMPTESVTDLQDDDVVEILNVPWILCSNHGVPRRTFGIHVGSSVEPGFQVEHYTGSYSSILSYQELVDAEDNDKVILIVKELTKRI